MSKPVVVTEMSSASAEYISLVHRGANRIGFRVLKQDNQENVMLNLNSVGLNIARALKGETAPQATGPLVVGIATKAEGAQLALVKKALEDNGYLVDNCETSEDGTTMFRQADADSEDLALVRLSDNTVLVMKGFSPYNDEASSDFLTNVKAHGFYSSINTATEAFRTALYQVLRDSNDGSAAANSAKSLFRDFEAYVSGLMRDLPSKAFKMDAEITEGLIALKAEEAPEPEAAPVVDPVVEPEAAPVSEADPAPAADPAPVETAPVADAGLEQVMKALADLGERLGAVATAQDEMGVAQKSLVTRVDEVARKSDDALKAVNTTLIGGAPGEDQPSETVLTQKADSDPRSGNFDTAFLPRH